MPASLDLAHRLQKNTRSGNFPRQRFRQLLYVRGFGFCGFRGRCRRHCRWNWRRGCRFYHKFRFRRSRGCLGSLAIFLLRALNFHAALQERTIVDPDSARDDLALNMTVGANVEQVGAVNVSIHHPHHNNFTRMDVGLDLAAPAYRDSMLRKMNRSLHRSINEKMFLPADVPLDHNRCPDRCVRGYRSHRRHTPTRPTRCTLRQILRHSFRLPSLRDSTALPASVPVSCIDGILGKLWRTAMTLLHVIPSVVELPQEIPRSRGTL